MENTCIPVDITGHCLSQRQIRTVIPADGTDLNRLWKSRAVSAANPVIVVPGENRQRLSRYEELLPRFLEVKALAFSSDYGAIEAMNYFFDHGIKVPDQISIVGYDDSIYAEFVRPRLTTVHQDIHQKGVISLRRLHRMIEGETLKEMNIKSPVRLIKRESVKE